MNTKSSFSGEETLIQALDTNLGDHHWLAAAGGIYVFYL